MTYLYGDSTPLPLTSNVLEFLRDALDFAVFVLQADERINDGRTRIGTIERETNAELGRLDRLIGVVSRSVDDAEPGGTDSATARCAAHLKELITDTHRASVDAVRRELEAAIGRVQAEEAAVRAECAGALATMLAPHEPPEASTVTRLVLVQAGRYEAKLVGHAAFGLDWTFDLAVPDPWSGPVRIERLAPELEIRAPQVSGWITKEIKIRPQRLERHVLTELVVEGASTTFKLRVEPGMEAGFDVMMVDGAGVRATRAGPADDAATGAFEVDPEDAIELQSLARRLREAASGLVRQTLLSATVDGADFRAQPAFAPFVQRLVAMLAPIIREIAQRSLTENELVIRRPLADDRREEIFVAKATLREKYAVLDETQRALFAPLGLDAATRARPPPPSKPEPPTARAELAPSVRPAPLAPSRPPPPERSRAPRPPPPPRAAPAKKSVPPPATKPNKPPSPPPVLGARKNDALANTLRKIFNIARSGRTEDAYKKYAELFSSTVFAEYKPEEQREALRLMVHAKNIPKKTEAVREAYRIALGRLKALVDSVPEPADYEMLGMTHLALEEAQAASAAFEMALELERARNPTSELCSSLMKRVGQSN